MAPTQTYSWKRFWCPRESSFILDGGYLLDPEVAPWMEPAFSWHEISSHSCLALLGEPGIGKSNAMQSERQRIQAAASESGDALIWLDLKEYGSEDRLLRESFESQPFQDWLADSSILHLFLDSLDECRLQIPTVVNLLQGQLRRAQEHIGRLRLRIACRTAEWPNGLESELPHLWGKENYRAFELAPLRRIDVRLAADEEKLPDPDAFLSAIEHKSAQPLAIKPVTLKFLISLYRQGGHFPEKLSELYHEGCRVLASETSDSRKDAGREGSLSASHRLAVAARIAATSMFCKKAAVFKGGNPGDLSPEDLRIDDLTGGTESIGQDSFPVGEREIREVLATGLFSARGADRLAFAHQSYAEFLAAHYLVTRGVASEIMLKLIRHPDSQDGAIIPQLAEMAAWLAGMDSQVFPEILRTDPQILLRSDLEKVSPENRAQLVDRLLTLFAQQDLRDDWSTPYRRLYHPELSRQLRPYLQQKGKEGWLVRRVAIDIAEACFLRELQELLLEIALDPDDFYPTRVEAAHAVAQIGDRATVELLRPLASGVAEDSEDQLKGIALSALWPDSISAQDLFPLLTPAKEPNLYGQYREFLEKELAAGLRRIDLPYALQWIENPAADLEPHVNAMSVLENAILARSIQQAEQPEVLKALAKTLIARFEHRRWPDEPDIHQAVADLREPVRQRLIEKILELHELSDIPAVLAYGRPRLTRNEDLPWILEHLHGTTSKAELQGWAKLALRVFSLDAPGHAATVLEAAGSSSVLAEVFADYLGSIPLGSEKADRLKNRYQLQREDPLNAVQAPLEPSPEERVEHCLKAFEAGNENGWWWLCREISLQAGSSYYGSDFTPALNTQPGWQQADPSTRLRIVRAAESYLLQHEPQPQKWFGKNRYALPDLAGYKALCLLATEAPELWENLPASVWVKWMPLVLDYPLDSKRLEQGDLYLQVTARAYQEVPASFLDNLNQLINLRNRRQDNCWSLLQRLEACWDDRLTSFLTRKLQQRQLGGCFRVLLEKLLTRGVQPAEAYARKQVLQHSSSRDSQKMERAQAAAIALLRYAPDAGWPTLRVILDSNPAWGRQLFEEKSLYLRDLPKKVESRLSEAEVAEFFIWLANQYPFAADPSLDDVGSRRWDLARFRDSLLNHLQSWATPTAYRELERIVHLFPHVEQLKFRLLEARQTLLRETWLAPSPSDFLQLTQKKDVQWVRNSDDLLAVIIETLRRLQVKLQGKPPMAPFLWNGTRPKEEEDLSDWLKVHLEEDLQKLGVVSYREVQIQRGEETDLHITALAQDRDSGTQIPATAILEVKGSWHPEARTAMKTQLVDRYLQNSTCRHGIYLLGWYRCSAWDSTDSRSKKHKTWTREKAEKELAKQAQELSTSDLQIRSFLLDVTLRGKPTPPEKPTKDTRETANPVKLKPRAASKKSPFRKGR